MIFRDPTWRALFAPEGRLLEEGEIAHRPALARTLAAIATEGPEAFYSGPIADGIIAAIKSTGGIMIHEDLANYTALVYPALSGTYRGRRVYVPKAPTSGPVLLHMLNLLEKYDLKGEGRTGLNTHRFVEVMKCSWQSSFSSECLLTSHPFRQLDLLRGMIMDSKSRPSSQSGHQDQDMRS